MSANDKGTRRRALLAAVVLIPLSQHLLPCNSAYRRGAGPVFSSDTLALQSDNPCLTAQGPHPKPSAERQALRTAGRQEGQPWEDVLLTQTACAAKSQH